MMNNKLTDANITDEITAGEEMGALIGMLNGYVDHEDKAAKYLPHLLSLVSAAVVALREYRKAEQPALAMDSAEFINKFYKRYPLNTFESDSERAEALGYFMAGAELQCYGEFIVYAGDNYDE